MLLAKSVPLVFVVSVAAASAPRRAAVNVSGEYTSNWDAVRLEQVGDRVRGTYVCCGGGTIEGRVVEGRVIRYTWHEPRGAGHGAGVWTITPSGTLDGTWGHGKSVSDGGPWTLVPEGQTATIAQ